MIQTLVNCELVTLTLHQLMEHYVTHWEFRDFSGFQVKLVSFVELGQPDLNKVL